MQGEYGEHKRRGRIAETKHARNKAERCHNGAAGNAGSANGEYAKQQAEQNHGRKLGHRSIDHLTNGHNEEDFREHRATQMDVGEQRDAEAYHIATQRRRSAIGALKRNGERRSG